MSQPRAIAYCPHCRHDSPQHLIHVQETKETFVEPESGDREQEVFTYFVAVCETCQGLLIYAEMWSAAPDAFTDARLVWPDPKHLPDSVPQRIRDIYREAVMVQHGSPSAFATQIRRALEVLCQDRGVRSGPLQHRLEELATRHELPSVLSDMTDVLRILGNIGAHADDMDINLAHTWAIDQFFRAVLEYVYVAPGKLAAFRRQLDRLRNRTAN